MKQKVYITRRIPEIGIDLLKEKFEVKIFFENRRVDKTLLIREIEDCNAMISLLSDKIDEEVLDAAGNLKIVANYAVGYNNIDIQAAKSRKIMVTNTPGVLTNATGEIAFALLITLTRKIIEADRFTRRGKFIGWDPLLYLGDELNAKTIGIIGMGRIGRDMALKCRAFGMNVIYYNRKPVDKNIEKELQAAYVNFEELLENSDVISVHTPLADETFHMLEEKAFGRMKKGVYIINTSRGEVIDEKVLVHELKSGKVKGAGFDVYEFEPEITRDLLTMNNVVLLPHIGSATIETRNKMSEMAAENVIAALEGRRPENLVPELNGLF
ncbi:MAG: D-glycerate dehydrogenase [Deltaproteobacteria bacterium]|nr:D-glycerate dehydrogenase [Deltaproteobacteria bacterium]